MAEPASTLVHIGYHKTGSSLLQGAFFGGEGGGFALPETPRHHLVEVFVRPPPFCFKVNDALADYGAFLDTARAAGKVPVISHERFSGYPGSGGFDSPLIANRLAETFPGARVLIVVREQLASIRSMYSQYITDGGSLSFEDFVSRPDPEIHRMPGFQPEFYFYDNLVRAYWDRFGRDNVLVLPYEMLRGDRSGFSARICAFAGVNPVEIPDETVNSARAPLMQAAQRQVNRWFSDNQLSRQPVVRIRRVHKGFARAKPVFTRLSPPALDHWLANNLRAKINRKFRGMFAASNRHLGEMIGTDLSTYGYEVGSGIETDFPAADQTPGQSAPL